MATPMAPPMAATPQARIATKPRNAALPRCHTGIAPAAQGHAARTVPTVPTAPAPIPAAGPSAGISAPPVSQRGGGRIGKPASLLPNPPRFANRDEPSFGHPVLGAGSPLPHGYRSPLGAA